LHNNCEGFFIYCEIGYFIAESEKEGVPMQYIFDKTSVQSVAENLYSKKYIEQNEKLYEFFINNNTLMMSIYNDATQPTLIGTRILEKNVKGEYGVCEDGQKLIHIVTANKKYDLIYMSFDGVNLKKETIYSFSNHKMIPTTPAIQVKNDVIVIVLEFLTTVQPKEWWLRVYRKRKNIWNDYAVDHGEGLCYVQPDFKLDEQMNIHLVYRDRKEKSYLKYIYFDVRKEYQDSAKIILDSESDEYKPFLFINRFGEISVSWLEINHNDTVLCCSAISRESNREIYRVDVSRNLANVRIYFSGLHVFCIFQNEEDYYYDMCCGKKLMKHWNPKIMPKGGGTVMNSDSRLFLDIKRELEHRISELKNNSNTGDYEKTITELKDLNMSLLEQLSEKEKAITAAMNENSLLRSENETYKSSIEQLEERLREEQRVGEKTSIWDKINHFFIS
jgi:regulator of replication initiation timing